MDKKTFVDYLSEKKMITKQGDDFALELFLEGKFMLLMKVESMNISSETEVVFRNYMDSYEYTTLNLPYEKINSILLYRTSPYEMRKIKVNIK